MSRGTPPPATFEYAGSSLCSLALEFDGFHRQGD
jgi:hypothetical protein